MNQWSCVFCASMRPMNIRERTSAEADSRALTSKPNHESINICEPCKEWYTNDSRKETGNVLYFARLTKLQIPSTGSHHMFILCWEYLEDFDKKWSDEAVNNCQIWFTISQKLADSRQCGTRISTILTFDFINIWQTLKTVFHLCNWNEYYKKRHAIDIQCICSLFTA